MDQAFIQSFVDRFNRDKEEFNNRFEELNRKLKEIDSRFDRFDKGIQRIDERLAGIDDRQDAFYEQFGRFLNKFDNIEVYLTTIESKLKEYETLYLEGDRELDGNLIKLRIELQRIKPVIHWENRLNLSNKYNEIEQKLLQFEDVEE